MLQPLNSDSRIRQCLDMPYRDGVHYLKGASDPSDHIAINLRTESSVKIFLTRVVRVLTGVALLIPLINIIIDIALRKLLVKPSFNSVIERAALGSTEGSEASSTLSTVVEGPKIMNEEDLKKFAEEIISVAKDNSCELSYEIRNPENKKTERQLVFIMKFPDGRKSDEMSRSITFNQYTMKLERECLVPDLKFAIFTQARCQKTRYDLMWDVPGSEDSQEWKPKDFVEELPELHEYTKRPKLKVKEGAFEFLTKAANEWHRLTKSTLVFKDPTVEESRLDWGINYTVKFKVAESNEGPFKEVSIDAQVSKDNKEGTITYGKNDFMRNFIKSAWKKINGGN